MAAIMPLLLSSAERIATDLDDRAAAGEQLARVGATWAADVRWNGAAKCALDIALHDLAGKVLGIPVHELIGLPAEIPPTDFTIGIDEPAIVAQRAARAADFPALKIKCGGPQDLETLRAVREVFAGPIRVDANTGWTRDDAERLLPGDRSISASSSSSSRSRPAPIAISRWLQERSSIPIVADESAVTEEDLDALVGVVDGVNVKLAKCGGIGPGQGDADPRARARLPHLPRLHGGDVGRDRRGRRPSHRSPNGSTWTAACCSPTTRSRASSWTPTTAGSSPRGRVSASPCGTPDKTHARSVRAFGERPFVWITWWMKWWTSPLHATAASGLRCASTGCRGPT